MYYIIMDYLRLPAVYLTVTEYRKLLEMTGEIETQYEETKIKNEKRLVNVEAKKKTDPLWRPRKWRKR